MSNLLKEHEQYMRVALPLKNMYNNISNESAGSFIKDISQFFSGKLASLTEFINTQVTTRLNFKAKEKDNAFTVNLLNTLKDANLAKVNYGNVRKLIVPCVVGLETNMVDASKNCAIYLNRIENEAFQHLENLDVTVSKVIADPDYRLTTRPIIQDNKAADLVKDLDNNLKRMFDTKKITDTDHFENLFPNINSVKLVADTLVSGGKFINLDNMQALEKTIASIAEKTNILVDQMSDKSYEISKEVSRSLTIQLETCAQLVTSSVSYFHYYNQLVSVTDMCIKRICGMNLND